MAAGVVLLVAHEALKIGNSGFPCLAELAKKIGGVADQPPCLPSLVRPYNNCNVENG